MSTGVLLDRVSLDRADLDFRQLQSSLEEWRIYDKTPAEEVAARIAHAEVVVTNKVLLTAEHLAKAKNLKLICIAATGTNNVDMAAAQTHGITVCNATAYATPSVVQHVFSLILALLRHLPEYQQAVSEGRWQKSEQFCLLDYPIAELQDKVLGIIGFGELGQAVARMGECFGMQVLVAERPGRQAASTNRLLLEALLPQVDILSLHCPLAENTQGLIGRAEISLMKDDAILINTARGGIVDEQALAEALLDGQLGGAGIDVLAEEPPADTPLLSGSIPNLIVTPHIAWASRAARQRLLDQVAENIAAFYLGKPRNVIMC